MSSQLRAVAQPKRALDEEKDDLGEIFNVVVISPCQIWISNDPPSEHDFYDPNPCNITSFECYDAVANAAQGLAPPEQVTVQFDYELYYDETADLNRTVNAVESNMLQHLASVFNLLECPLAATRPKQRGIGNRNLQIFSEEMADLFVGVDSSPKDEPDTVNDECMVPVQESVKDGATCQPMTGYFSAAINADLQASPTAEASIKSGLLRLLRLGMHDDLYAGGAVRKVAFIGDRTTYVKPASPPKTTTTNQPQVDQGSGMAPVALAFVILACVLAFLIAGLLVANAYRKRRHSEQERGVVLEDFNYHSDEEVPKHAAVPWEKENVVIANEPGSLAERDELALEHQQGPVPVLQDPTMTLSTSSSPSSSPTKSVEEEVAVEPASPNSRNGSPVTPKKKRKRKKPTGSPDSLRETLQTLDSIAEEPSEAGAEPLESEDKCLA